MNNNLQELILEEAFATIFTSEPQSDLSYLEILKSVGSGNSSFADYKLYPCFEYVGNDDESLVSDIYGLEKSLQDFANKLTNIQASANSYKIEIELTEEDLECLKDVVYNNNKVEWRYTIDDIGDVNIEFISEDESFQRSQ